MGRPPMRLRLLTLTEAEIFEVTGYRRPAEQMTWFRNFGIPAARRADGTVSVARDHYLGHARRPSTVPESRPQLKSDRTAE
jgi:Domain of unknown function (DUF4224)